MTNATVEPTALGILPLVSYNYLVPRDSDYLGQMAWFGLWKPGYSVFKFRRTVSRDVTDWGFIEMHGMALPMYDFCGGILTSSPNVRVHTPQIDTFNPRASWHNKSDQMWRSPVPCYGATGRTTNRLGTDEDIARLLNMIPSVDPYLGPGPWTLGEMRAAGERSIAAWLASIAMNWGRRGIYGADRFTYDTYLRRVVKAIKTLPFAWSQLPAASCLYTTTTGRATSVRPGGTGQRNAIFKTEGAKYSAGARYRNPNSGRAVSMCAAVMPDYGRFSTNAGHIWNRMADEIPQREWLKLTAQEYVDLLPASLIHNG